MSKEYEEKINNLSEQNRKIFDDLYKAYLFYFPLVATELTGEERVKAGKIKPNVFIHNNGLPDIKDNPPGGYNLDTVYSFTYIDVSKEPLIFERPIVDRFFTLLLMDAFANAIGVLGNGGIGGKDASKYVLYGPNYKGDLPEGYVPVALTTNHVSGLIRTNIYENTKEELEVVKGIQGKLVLKPLSEIDNHNFVTETLSWEETTDNDAVFHFFDFDTETFFNYSNKALLLNPYVDVERELAKSFEKYNIGLNETFSLAQFDDELAEVLKNLPNITRDRLQKGVSLGTEVYNHTVYMPEDVSLPGSDIEFKAQIAQWGIGVNPSYAAMYPNTGKDQNGDPITSENKYIIHFDKDSLPRVNYDEGGYWSISAYQGKDLYLIPNEIDRYKISSYDKLVYDENGGLTIFIQKEPVEGELKNNWLPINGDQIDITWRLYIPTEEAIKREWVVPYVEKV